MIDNNSIITRRFIDPSSSPTFAGLTLSNLTSGSILFAGTGGVISQDNSTLFWDDTNKRLSLNTIATPATLTIDTTIGTAVPCMRIRDAAAPRYRTDWALASTTGGGASINSYDDTGGVFLNFTIDGAIVSLNTAVGTGPVSIGSGGLQLMGGITSAGDVLVGSGGGGTFMVGSNNYAGTRMQIDANSFANYFSTEANPRMNFNRDAGGGGLAGFAFGPGGAVAVDTIVYRNGAAEVGIKNNLTLAGVIKTAINVTWDLGAVTGGAVALDTLNYVAVTIGGVPVKLLKAA